MDFSRTPERSLYGNYMQNYRDGGGGRGSSHISKYFNQSDLKSIFWGLVIPGIADERYCLGSYMDGNMLLVLGTAPSSSFTVSAQAYLIRLHKCSAKKNCT